VTTGLGREYALLLASRGAKVVGKTANKIYGGRAPPTKYDPATKKDQTVLRQHLDFTKMLQYNTLQFTSLCEVVDSKHNQGE